MFINIVALAGREEGRLEGVKLNTKTNLIHFLEYVDVVKGKYLVFNIHLQYTMVQITASPDVATGPPRVLFGRLQLYPNTRTFLLFFYIKLPTIP